MWRIVDDAFAESAVHGDQERAATVRIEDRRRRPVAHELKGCKNIVKLGLSERSARKEIAAVGRGRLATGGDHLRELPILSSRDAHHASIGVRTAKRHAEVGMDAKAPGKIA